MAEAKVTRRGSTVAKTCLFEGCEELHRNDGDFCHRHIRRASKADDTAKPKKRWQPPSAPKCAVCNQTAYEMERMIVEGKTIHKTCFKCSHCNGRLTLSSMSALNNQLFCKTHFEQLFKERGRYDFAA